MRLMADTIDGDGKEFFVLKEEEVVSNAPVIKVLELEDKSWVFELWADKIKLFGGSRSDLLFGVLLRIVLQLPDELRKRGTNSVFNHSEKRCRLNGSNTLTNKKNTTTNTQIKKIFQLVLTSIMLSPV